MENSAKANTELN